MTASLGPILRLGLVASVLGLAGCHSKAADDAAGQLAYHKGFDALRSGDYLKAEQFLSEAKRQFPDDPYVLLNLGVVAQNLGRFEEARAYYERVADEAEDVMPVQVTDPAATGKSLGDLARDNMASLPR